MPSKIQVDQIAGATGSTVTLPSGQTLDLSSGTVNLPSAALSALNASNLTSGTVPSARLSLVEADIPNHSTSKLTSGTLGTARGGTGLTTIGTANQVLRVNSGATALEFGSVSSDYVKLAETTASNVSIVSLNGYFTSDYDVYKIYIDGLYGSSNQVYVLMTFNTTGSYTEQTSNYSHLMSSYLDSANATTGAWSANYGTSFSRISWVSSTQAKGGAIDLTLFNPMSSTYHKHFCGTSVSDGTSYEGWGAITGIWKDSTPITGLNFKMASGNIYARKIRLYGIKN